MNITIKLYSSALIPCDLLQIYLDLSSNQLEEVKIRTGPQASSQGNGPQTSAGHPLEQMFLQNNLLGRIDMEILRLPSLRVLCVDVNRIVRLPLPVHWRCSNLEVSSLFVH